MALTVGTRLGSYEIVGTLGAGGMGEVYRATDTKLKRSVAIKVLQSAVASNVERLARFQREAELLAALNHPNIGQIYGIHDVDGAKALVMELVEGPTLADRIAHGPIPLAETLAIAQQIADALESAHERGIVHRDLKPANIKVRDDGTVKVLDFGLAKAVSADSSISISDLPSRSPTITSPAMTHAGVILGTAAYMSPEQARGKAVDARADVWAFGCVLYEMLTARRAFAGDEVSDALASVLARDPDWDVVPASLVGLLKKCLEKDPRKRLRHIGDWELLVGTPDRAITQAPASRSAWIWPATTAAAIATATGIAAMAWTSRAAPAASPHLRINLQLPSTVAVPARPTIYVSPDGRRAAIRTRGAADGPAAPERLWLWSFDAGTATPIAGTEGARRVFWSPDGRYLAGVVGGALKKFDTSGGPGQTIASALDLKTGASGFGGAWNRANVLLVESEEGGLHRVSADGGMPAEVTRAAAGELHHELAVFLPDDRHFLYFRHTRNPEQMGIFVGDLNAPPADQSPTRLLAADDGLSYIEDPEGGDGVVLFMRQGTLLAQRFDPAALQLRGSPIAVAADVSSIAGEGWLSASRSGSVLVFGTGFVATALRAVVPTWVDRSGRETPLPLRPHNYQYPRISPDGKRLAVAQESERPEESDLWVYTVETGAAVRLTHAGRNTLPVWSSNGERIVFSSTQDLPTGTLPVGAGQWGNLYAIRSDGTGNVERLTTDPEISQALSGVSPDGRQLFYTKVISVGSHWEITRVALDQNGSQTTLLPGPFRRSSAEVSPDGGLIAYRSDDTGAFEIYVQTYPDMNAKIPVSIGGGDSPVWSADGRELFYRAGERVMAVEVTRQPTLRAAPPRELFRGAYVNPAAGGRQYHVGPDGRFVVLKRVTTDATAAQPRIVLDVNWLRALKER
jgi:eukaryotic-like serine/threonine-protein kinase